MAYPPVIPPTTRTDNTDMVTVHASDHNALATALANAPWGYVRTPVFALIGAPTGVVAETAIPLLSGLTFTAIAGRRYRVQLQANVLTSIANGVGAIYIKDGSTQIRRVLAYTSPNAGYSFQIHGLWEGTFTPGAHTINCTMGIASGSGTMSMDVNDATFLGISDVGAA